MSTCAASVYRRPVSPPERCDRPAKGERSRIDDAGARWVLPACWQHLDMKREPFAWAPPPKVAS